MILSRSFFARDTRTVAQELLGKYLWYQSPGGLVVGEIVETEAYLGPSDPAAHSARGLTPRTKTMFGEPGRLYVYLIYGLHYCFNFVTYQPGKGQAVLIRAVKPLVGTELMQARRGTKKTTELCNGPAKVAQAFGITLLDDGKSLLEPDFCLKDQVPEYDLKVSSLDIAVSPRIGITKAADWPLRFFVKNSEYISHFRKTR